MIDIVGKIGSMALIRKEDGDIDYNRLSRLSRDLKPGMVLVTSGAAEIGRLDYIQRHGREPAGNGAERKIDYAAQGQAILMAQYRQFIDARYSVRQLLVEHQHFNDPEKRAHLRRLLGRAPEQGAIPIVNYNDSVSSDEIRKMELTERRRDGYNVVECVDNDETAAVIAELVEAKTLVILTSTLGIYEDPSDQKTLVDTITGADAEELRINIEQKQKLCHGSSRAGAGGAYAKLEYIKRPATRGINVIIGSAAYHFNDLIEGRVPHTRVGIGL